MKEDAGETGVGKSAKGVGVSGDGGTGVKVSVGEGGMGVRVAVGDGGTGVKVGVGVGVKICVGVGLGGEALGLELRGRPSQ